ncbi:iron ABC transporter substrate-binding protein [soil metagenome]
MVFRRRARWALLVIAVLAAACGDDDGGAASAGEGSGQEKLTIYSGREEEYVAPVYRQIERDLGIDLDVRYGDSAELAATILEEGDATPADIFFSQDAGSLGAVAEAGLFAELDDEVLDRVSGRFRSPDGSWVGTSGRARVAAYNTDALSESDLPASIVEFTDPAWKERIGFPPTNSSFQAFVAAMIITQGEDSTRRFLEGLVANEPKLYEDNSSTVKAVADGEIDVGFVNHYYIYEVAEEEGDIPVQNHFFRDGDPGSLVNAAGVGVLASSDDRDSAAEVVDFLTGEEAQEYFDEEMQEYPVVEGMETSTDLIPLAEIESPDIDLSDLGGTLEPALRLLAEVGLL